MGILKNTVADILFQLIEEGAFAGSNIAETFRAGEFACLRAGKRQIYTVEDQVRLLYVCYPRDWKLVEQPVDGD